MKIYDLRQLTGDNQQTMAQEIGVSISTISNWERKDRSIGDLHSITAKEVTRYARKHGIEIRQ